MQKNKWGSLLIVIGLLALIIPTHVIGIDKFLTFDEPWWVISGSNYYYALTHRDFANTIYDYHPAVTTTWVVTAGMLSYFPEYRGFGQGYFDVRKPQFENFLREHGKEAIDLVRDSRLIQTALLTMLALLGFFLLQLIFDWTVAFLAIVLAMNAPFFLGHSRLLNHEGMLALFALVSVLGMVVYVNKERKLIYLLISGAAFGLAQLTKSSSIVVIPVVGLILFVELFKRDGELLKAKIWRAVKSFVVWFLAAAFVFVALWPGMWVTPGKMLYEIYGNAFSYAFQGARLDVTQEVQPPSGFDLMSALSGSAQYLNRWAITSTMLSWLGLIFALILLFFKINGTSGSPVKSTIMYLAILAALFILMFSIAKGRDSPHYILTSFVCLDVIAGIGWGYLLLWLQNRWKVFSNIYVKSSIVILLALLQIGNTLPYYPYYFTYQNSLVAGASSYGYGEGLDQAAEYIAQKPGAENIKVYAYAGMGAFSFFYPGKTETLKRVYLSEPGMPSIISGIQQADYLVVYSVAQNRQPESVKFLQDLQNIQPEHTIYIHGVEYVRIYKVSDIPQSVYDEMSK